MNWRERIVLGIVVGSLGIVTRSGTAMIMRGLYGVPDQGLIFFGVTAWLTLGAAAPLFAWLADRFPERCHIPVHIAAFAASSLLLSFISQLITFLRWPMPLFEHFGSLAAINFPTHLFLYLIVAGVARAVRLHRGVASEARERIRIDAEIAARTSEALKKQLQPELIIGVLDRIAALARENAVAAERLLLRLARHVRLLLRACSEEEWTPSDEKRIATSAAALGAKIGMTVETAPVQRRSTGDLASPDPAGLPVLDRRSSGAALLAAVLLLFFALDVYVQTPLRLGEPPIIAATRDYAILLWLAAAPLLALGVASLATLRFRYAVTGVVLLTYFTAAGIVAGSILLQGDGISHKTATVVVPILALRNVMVAAGLAAITFSIAWSRRLIRARLANARLANEVTIAEAQNLEARLHPHFLFNALNSIVTLLRERPEAAQTMTERLAAFLGFAVRTAGRQEWTLDEERAAIEDYLFIQRVRLGRRLQTRWQVAPRVAGATLPRFLLQPLLENAVKHGASRLEEGSSVVVSIARERQRLHVRVENDMPEEKEERVAFGRGLRYVASRLVTLYGSEGRLEVARAARRFTVSCRFPYQPKEVV